MALLCAGHPLPLVFGIPYSGNPEAISSLRILDFVNFGPGEREKVIFLFGRGPISYNSIDSIFLYDTPRVPPWARERSERALRAHSFQST